MCWGWIEGCVFLHRGCWGYSGGVADSSDGLPKLHFKDLTRRPKQQKANRAQTTWEQLPLFFLSKPFTDNTFLPTRTVTIKVFISLEFKYVNTDGFTPLSSSWLIWAWVRPQCYRNKQLFSGSLYRSASTYFQIHAWSIEQKDKREAGN